MSTYLLKLEIHIHDEYIILTTIIHVILFYFFFIRKGTCHHTIRATLSSEYLFTEPHNSVFSYTGLWCRYRDIQLTNRNHKSKINHAPPPHDNPPLGITAAWNYKPQPLRTHIPDSTPVLLTTIIIIKSRSHNKLCYYTLILIYLQLFGNKNLGLQPSGTTAMSIQISR